MAPNEQGRKLAHADLPKVVANDSGVRLKPPSNSASMMEPETIRGKSDSGEGPKQGLMLTVRRAGKRISNVFLRALAGLKDVDDLDRVPTPIPRDVVMAERGENGILLARGNEGGKKNEAA